jgi:hypothetical protein
MKREAKQRQQSDCVVAAISNAVQIPYKMVKDKCGTTKGGLDYGETLWLLCEFGNWRETKVRSHMVLKDWLKRKRNQVGQFVLLLNSGFSELHAIAVVDGKVYGHYSETWSIAEYYRLMASRWPHVK